MWSLLLVVPVSSLRAGPLSPRVGSLAHLLDSLTRQDASNPTLNDLSGGFLSLLLGRRHHLAIVHTLSHVVRLQGGVDLLESVEVTTATLSTSFVLLDQPNGLHDVQIVEVERVVGCLFDGLRSLETLHQNVVDLCFFFVGGQDLLGWTVIIGLLLSFLSFFLATLLSFLGFAAAVNFLLEDEVDGDVVVLLEVARHRDLNHRWIILEIKEKTVKMDVDGALAEVEVDEPLFELTNASNRAF